MHGHGSNPRLQPDTTQSIPLMAYYREEESGMPNSPDKVGMAIHQENRNNVPAGQDEKRTSKPVFDEYSPQLEGITDEDREWLSTITPKEEDRIFRKVDFHLIPMLCLVNVLWALDKANIGTCPTDRPL
jgi:hypothetical protein